MWPLQRGALGAEGPGDEDWMHTPTPASSSILALCPLKLCPLKLCPLLGTKDTFSSLGEIPAE